MDATIDEISEAIVRAIRTTWSDPASNLESSPVLAAGEEFGWLYVTQGTPQDTTMDPGVYWCTILTGTNVQCVIVLPTAQDVSTAKGTSLPVNATGNVTWVNGTVLKPTPGGFGWTRLVLRSRTQMRFILLGTTSQQDAVLFLRQSQMG
jgi:hypothetical protein